MKYLIEYSVCRQVYDIYDMKPPNPIKGQEKVRVMSLDHNQMDSLVDFVLAKAKMDSILTLENLR